MHLDLSDRLLMYKHLGRTPKFLREQRVEKFQEKHQSLLESLINKLRGVELEEGQTSVNNKNKNKNNVNELPLADVEGPEADVEKFQFIAKLILSDDPRKQFEGTVHARKLLSREGNPPINCAIQSGILPVLVEFLTRSGSTSLQMEAAWAITNIASGTSEHTKRVIDSGAVPLFVQLLSSPDEMVREQAVWGLGNIAGDSPEARDFVLANGALAPLLANIQPDSRASLLRNSVWTLSNCVRGKPAPRLETIRAALPVLAKAVYFQDIEALTDACWALSYCSDGANERIQAVIESGVVRRMVELLCHDGSVVTPALRVIGNIVTGDDIQTQVVINCGALPNLAQLFDHRKAGVRKEVCWTISNICAGGRNQIGAVIDAGLIPRLIRMLNQEDFNIKKEAAWAICNLFEGGSEEQIQFVNNQGGVQSLVDLLDVNDGRIIECVLSGLDTMVSKSHAGKQLLGNNEDAMEKINRLANEGKAAAIRLLDRLQDLE